MGYAEYTNYVDSGIPWFGKYPSHWNLKRLKWTIDKLKNGVWGAEPDGLNEIIVLRVADFDRTSLRIREDNLTVRSVEERERIGRLLSRDDLLIEKSGGGETQLVGAVVQFDKEFSAITSNFIASMKPAKGFSSRYLTYLHFHLYANRVNERSIKQTTGIQNLDSTIYFDEIVALPDLEEQKEIAHFLDYKTAQIETLTKKKKDLIEKLRERRTAIISQVVTKGLDVHVPMRPSGIDWLGPIPEHWEVKRLKWAVMLQRGHDLPAQERVEGDVPVVTSSGIAAYHDRAIAKAPGIVTGRYGTIGVFHLIEEDYWPLNTTLYSNDLNGNCPRFLRALLEHIAPLFLLNSVKSAVPGVDRNDILSIPVALPEPGEQRAIADYLDEESKRIGQMIEKIEAAIIILDEYRTGLVTAAITGKVDVRNVNLRNRK